MNFNAYLENAWTFSQIISYIATVIYVASFLFKTRKNILITQIIGCSLWGIHYYLIGQSPTAIVQIVAIISFIVYVFKDKSKFIASIYMPIIFSVLGVLVAMLPMITPLFEFNSVGWYFDIIPIIGSILTAFTFYFSSEKKIRLFSLITRVLFLTFNIRVGSIGGVICETFTLITIIIALIKYRKTTKTENTEE